MPTPTLEEQLAELRRLSTPQLQARYAEVFGERTPANNKVWLLRRIAWRLQALAEGDLSERARQRAAELAHDADLRRNPPPAKRPAQPAPERTALGRLDRAADDRLPPPGTVLTRRYKGADVQVQVLQQGFAFRGQVYPSLSAVARAVTGSHCNGFYFFKLNAQGDNA